MHYVYSASQRHGYGNVRFRQLRLQISRYFISYEYYIYIMSGFTHNTLRALYTSQEYEIWINYARISPPGIVNTTFITDNSD